MDWGKYRHCAKSKDWKNWDELTGSEIIKKLDYYMRFSMNNLIYPEMIGFAFFSTFFLPNNPEQEFLNSPRKREWQIVLMGITAMQYAVISKKPHLSRLFVSLKLDGNDQKRFADDAVFNFKLLIPGKTRKVRVIGNDNKSQ